MRKSFMTGVVLLAAACTGRSRSVEPEASPLPPPASDVVVPDQPTDGPDLGSIQSPGDLSTGEPVETEPDLAAITGLSEEQLSEGHTYVGSWDGRQDEVPDDVLWHVKSVRGSANATGVEETPPPSGSNTPPASTPPGSSIPSPSPSPSTKDEVIFRIPAGTGEGDWNTADTEVVAKVGVKFVIINDDDRVHQWHTNGTPCPHGKTIPPGGRDECVPSTTFSDGPLYDHISRGKFYIRAER